MLKMPMPLLKARGLRGKAPPPVFQYSQANLDIINILLRLFDVLSQQQLHCYVFHYADLRLILNDECLGR